MKQEAPQPQFEDAFVDVQGVQVHYLHAGTGRPMLLIHGMVGSSANWRSTIPALARDASVYAIDLVNMGRSGRVEGLDASLHATADRLVAIMDALQLPTADIVGHSHGGSVALMLAALYPERVRRLILFAPANPFCRAGDRMVRVYSSHWGTLLARALPYLPSPFQRLALGEIYGGPDRVADSSLHEIVEGLRSPGTLRHVLAIIRTWFAEMETLKRALPRVARVPTLLVWGDCDCTVSLASGIRLKRKLRGAKLVIVPRAGHSVFEQFPEQANRILLDWLNRTAPPDRVAYVPVAASAAASNPRKRPRFAATNSRYNALSPET